MSETRKVIIIGAGVGGLALAQGLERRGISFTVYERDASLDSRKQGYRLRLGGQLPSQLEDLLTPDSWQVLMETSSMTFAGEMNVCATSGATTAHRREDAFRPATATALRHLSVDRGMLRKALTKGISHGICFGKEFLRFEMLGGKKTDDTSHHHADPPGLVRAIFSDGSTAEGSLLVGADGSRSAVCRQFLPAIQPPVTDTYCVYGKSILEPRLTDSFPERYRRCITVVKDETPIIQSIISGESPVTMVLEPCTFSNRDRYPYLPHDYIHWGILFRADRLPYAETDLTERLREHPTDVALELSAGWDASVRSLIEMQHVESASGMRIRSAPSKLAEWESSSRVTLLGDAIHSMSPAGGVGATATLNDAIELTGALGGEAWTVDAIAAYEKKLRGFAGACIQRTNAAISRMLGS